MIIKKREPKIKDKPKDMAEWLCNVRGIPYSDRESFFEPTEDMLIDPFDLHNMDEVISRIKKAVDNDEIVYFYGDP